MTEHNGVFVLTPHEVELMEADVAEPLEDQVARAVKHAELREAKIVQFTLAFWQDGKRIDHRQNVRFAELGEGQLCNAEQVDIASGGREGIWIHVHDTLSDFVWARMRIQTDFLDKNVVVSLAPGSLTLRSQT